MKHKVKSINKYSLAFERDYNFYLENKDIFKFYGDTINNNVFTFSKDGLTAKEAFYIYDTYGKKNYCKEIELLKEIISCKNSINFHIKTLWGDSYSIPYECIATFYNIDNVPDWVYVSLLNHRRKNIIIETAEFAFVRLTPLETKKVSVSKKFLEGYHKKYPMSEIISTIRELAKKYKQKQKEVKYYELL